LIFNALQQFRRVSIFYFQPRATSSYRKFSRLLIVKMP